MAARATDIFPDQQFIAPRGANEPLITYGPRALFEMPLRGLQIGVNDTAQAMQDLGKYYFQTPAQAAAAQAAGQQKPQAAASAFPRSFNDPVYAQAEASVAQQLGGPFAGTLANMLGRVRMLGERSNAGQVSSAGANTPYQITPPTRQGIIKKYGFDPWSSPVNAARGAAYVLMEQAGAFSGKGAVNLNDPNVQARAFGGYFGGGKGAANPFSAAYGSKDESVGSYVMRTMGQHPGLSAPFVSPFDPTYAQAAMNQLGVAQQAAKTPFSVSTDVGPMPQIPAPEPTPKTDFSQADAALEALRPTEVTAKEIHDLKWKNFWSGLGRAMATMPGGAGIGDFFLRLGGGALMGKAAGMEEIDQKKSEYDQKFARFQAALYEHDFQKAQIAHSELMNDWQANRQWALDKYQQGMALWTSNAKPTIVGNDIVFTKTTPEGKTTVQGIPINSMVDADFAMKRAQLYGGMFDQQQGANAQVTGIENNIQGQIAMAKAGAVLAGQGSDQEKAAAAAFAPVQAAGFAVDSGQVDAVLGPDEAAKLTDSVQKTLVSRGLYPGTKDYSEGFAKMMQQQLAMAAFADPKLMEKLSKLSPAAQMFENYANYQQSKTTTQSTVDSRGRRTYRTTTTEPSGGSGDTGASGITPLDVFQQNYLRQ